jgi:hypothetical protein
MLALHRNSDLRLCGATTVVSGQSTVFANGKLVSVNDDLNTHGKGNLIALCKNVFINGKLVVINGNSASADSFCPAEGGDHCTPSSSSGSDNVFVGS